MTIPDSMNKLDAFIHHLEAVHQHSQEFQQTTREIPEQQMQLVQTHAEALQIALEELQVAEEELRQQNEELAETRQLVENERQRYQELFEFAPDPYVVTDIHGTVQEGNRAASRLLNISQKHLMGKPLVNFVQDEDRRTFRTILSQLPTVNRIQEWEVNLQGRRSEEFQVALTIETVRNSQGESIALRWLLRDITARKQAEEQLHQTQLENLQLVEADRLKNQLIRNISHELRTPINAIVGFSNLLVSHLYSHADTRLIHILERISVNSQHLLALIEGILDFSNLHTNRLELNLELFDLAELAHDTVNQLRSLAEQKRLELFLDLDQTAIPVMNDSMRVRQVLINLLANAIKFTETGSVQLRVQQLGDDRILLTIQDTGIGIAPENQERIFQEFWQLNQSFSRRYGGTGLGLSIAHALVRLMQGSISVQSQVGEGSIFKVELPRWIFSSG